MKSQLTGKDPDSGKELGQEKKGVSKDEMVGWHHQLNGHKFEQTPGDSEGQGNPAFLMGLQRAGHDLVNNNNNRQQCV